MLGIIAFAAPVFQVVLSSACLFAHVALISFAGAEDVLLLVHASACEVGGGG